jgi:hypothetical protein
MLISSVRRRNEVRQWLGYSTSISGIDRQQQQLQRITPGTGTWLFEDSQFANWRHTSSASNVLWLKGGPGVGKSVLCANAINELQESQLDAAIVFHYFTFDDSDTRLTIYRSLAVQLFHELYDGSTEISEHVIEIASGAFNLDSVKKLIKVLIAELRATYIFLDGIDEEISTTERWDAANDIISFLLNIARQEDSPLKFWCSSQDRQKIRSLLGDCEEIHLGAATNDKDIGAFFQAALEASELEELDSSTKSDIQQSLKKQVDGNFLWASFMLETIADAPSLKQLQAVMKQGLPESFEKYLERKIAGIKPSHHAFLG